MTPGIAGAIDPIMERLEEQIRWYDDKSGSNRKIYKRIKIVEISAAALIPFVAPLKFFQATPTPSRLAVLFSAATITGALGVLITVLEGMIHLNQYQRHWINYRSTCEALKHEKFIYLGNASPYASANDARALLAERIESLISQEESKWASMQFQDEKR
jgi:Protein of unknown function (DUF4231)